MKRFNLRKYSYVVLWLALILTVGAVWLFGGRAVRKDRAAVSPAPSAGPVPAEDALTLPQTPSSPVPSPAQTAGASKNKEELLGVWVPYMSLTVEEGTREAFEENFRNIADSAAQKGLNALFVHVRPFCDALYSSELFPWSHILTGTQGKDPGFDPLAFMVAYTHEKGMEFHAWLNPLRVRTTETPETLAEDNPYSVLREDCPYYFMEWEGGVYLDPAYPYVRTLIARGAAEIAERYEVDGIHFDDYFYPSEDPSLDSEAYTLYAGSVETPLSLAEWRQANISAMVQEVWEKVKKANPDAAFGISPQGNIENDEKMGADVRVWCAAAGYIDYICPQLYYSFENEALGYGEALEEWMALPRREGLTVYAGLALYKAGSDADEGTWLLSDDVLRRQIESARAARCGGVVLYSSDYLDAEQTKAEMTNAMAVISN